MTQSTDWSEVAELVHKAEDLGGEVGVTLLAPNGDRYDYKEHRQFGAASTVKIPLMIEIYRQIDRGERALTDRYVLRDEDRAVGSGVMHHLDTGATLTLNDLIYLMISISDNTATNLLIDMAGMEQVTETMRALGMPNSLLGRKMKGRPAQGDEQENWATSSDYVTLVKALLEQRVASPESCDRMIAMLEKQTTRRISRYLPQEEGIRWGSKPGSVKGVTNDAGFIMTPKGTLIVSIFCENLPDGPSGEQVIAYISRAAMKATGIVEPLYTS